MKNKNVLFGLIALVTAGSVLIISAYGISKKNKYSVRNEQNHKAGYGINGAIEYLSNIRNNKTTGDIDPKWVLKAREDVDNLSNQKSGNALGLNWSELGPDNIGGRTRAILIDKNNPNIMFAGGVCGGLWKSTTGGSSWTSVNGFSENIAICSIAQSSDGTIYVGTGEGLGNATGAANGSTSFIGKGMYKSADGINFTPIPSTIPTVGNTSSTAWAFINRIACDPVNPNRIYAATNLGLRSTDDGGNTWIWPVKLANGNDNKQSSTDVDVASDGTVIVATGTKCYISPNGNDNTFVNQSTGTSDHLPIGGLSRIEFAIAPSNPNYMYASAAASDGTLKNIYRSTDKGETWSIIGPGGSSSFQPFSNQGSYDNVIVVHPTNPDRIFVGGIDMWEWQNGYNWIQKSLWYLDRTSIYYVHADHHVYVFNPTNPDVMFIGSDGGVSRSLDCGETFYTMNINYNTVQSYALSCSPSGWIMSGNQDNGTLLLPRLLPFQKHGYEVKGGDGGWSTFSYINPDAFFATTYYAGTGRSPDKGASFYPAADGSSPFFSKRMLALGTPGTTFPASFVTPLLMWESYDDIYSSDSITYTPLQVLNEKIYKKPADVNVVYFDNIFARGGQTYASIEPGSINILCGSIHVTDDGNGHFIGNVNPDSISTINYTNGKFHIVFSITPSTGSNVLASYKIKHVAGSYIVVQSKNKPGIFLYKTPEALDFGDSIRIQDVVQAKFYLGANAGIWMTKEALNFAKQPEWFRVASFSNSSYETTQCLALSHDGNYLFVGSSAGKLYRISNLRSAQDSISADYGTTASPNIYSVIETKQLSISSSGRAITSIAVDPNNANNIVVTLGNYGETSYIYYSGNALDKIPTFSSKQGNLPAMPVYASVIPIFNSGTVLIGTEYGIYSTENITAASPQWSDENTGLDHVPVYMLRQQQYSYWDDKNCQVKNYGTIYAGTHGRGIFECTKYTSINDHYQQETSGVYIPMSVSIYPNPVSDNATLSFTLPKIGNVKAKVFDMSGKIVKSIDMSELSKGYHTYTVNFSDLRKGTYIVNLVSGELSAIAKFLIY